MFGNSSWGDYIISSSGVNRTRKFSKMKLLWVKISWKWKTIILLIFILFTNDEIFIILFICIGFIHFTLNKFKKQHVA